MPAMIERRFFEWDERDNNTPVALGMEIDQLLADRVVFEQKNEDELTYQLSENSDIWIGENDGVVDYIYFTSNAGDGLLNIDPFEFKYPATRPITQYLGKKYPELKYDSLEMVRKVYKGDLLYLIFRDYIPTNIFLMRLI